MWRALRSRDSSARLRLTLRLRWRSFAVVLSGALALATLITGAAAWLPLVLALGAVYAAGRPFGGAVTYPESEAEAELRYGYLGTSLLCASLRQGERRMGLLFRDEVADDDTWRELVTRLRYLSGRN